ncbi:MAG: phosphate-selective porin O and P [Gammaproteobacteria bacterium]|nr:phosphate-selective porin O and P [Gammaproteobacteria bacterium]
MINKTIFKKTLAAAAIVAGLSAIQVAEAANWLMLQGTERPGTAGRAKVWGFIQAQYQADDSEPFTHPTDGDLYIPPKLIGPNLTSQQQFNVNRARLGLRGTGMPLDSSVNYFLLAEFGNNGITANDNDAVVSDASITVNTDAVRIRTGLFKTPGPEEALQAIHVFDYVNFTSVTNQLMLERFPQLGDVNTARADLALDTNKGSISAYSRPVGAFRDTGVQFFQSYKMGGWDHSYAVMLGNGNGMNFGDTNNSKDLYLYWASEKSFGGKGPRMQGLKIFAWSQSGKRYDAYDITTTDEQDRTRSGFGVKYLKMPFRVTFETMSGNGMIFQGQHRPQDAINDLEASGNYLDFGYYIPNSKWEVDLRVDTYTRGENHGTSAAGDESTFDTNTVAAQYHINKKSRLTMSYDMRTFASDTAAVNTQLKGVANRLALQLTHIF